MGIYGETKGYQELSPNPAFGDPKDIERLNAQRRQQTEGAEKPTLDDLYHAKEQIEYQMSKVSSVDRPVLEKRLEEVNAQIAELENPAASKMVA